MMFCVKLKPNDINCFFPESTPMKLTIKNAVHCCCKK